MLEIIAQHEKMWLEVSLGGAIIKCYEEGLKYLAGC